MEASQDQQDIQLRLDLLSKLREEILRRDLSNTENFDRTVLSLSTVFMGFSIGFVRANPAYRYQSCPTLVWASWLFFCVSIASTIVSFFVSQIGLAKQLKCAERYYIDRDEDAIKGAAPLSWATRVLNYVSGVCFVLGIVASAWFAILNLGGSNV